MNCPICKSTNLTRESLIVTRGTGYPYSCKGCGFRFLAQDGKLISPLSLTGYKYLCPNCKKSTPKEVVLPVLPPRLGLECTTCNKIICYWEGEATVDMPMASEDCFRFSDFFEDYEPSADPLITSLQVAIMETLFDTLPLPLTDVVSLFERRLEQSEVIQQKKRRRLTKERKEEMLTEVKVAERKQKRKRKKKETPPPPPPVAPPEQLDHPAGFGGEPADGQTLNPSVPVEPTPDEKPKKKKGKKNAKRKKRRRAKEEA